MFGFIGKFKSEVIAGFDAVHQRLVTLEAQVSALFEHTKMTASQAVTTAETVAAQDAATAKADVAEVETTAAAVTNVAADVAKVEADAKQV